jgi:dTDP-D-glucose 4,6-dehydratase
MMAAKEFGVVCALYVSSTEVYGEVSGEISESTPLAPVNTYVSAQLASCGHAQRRRRQTKSSNIGFSICP